MKKFLYAVSFAAMMTSLVLTGCSKKIDRDAETEAKIVGEWESTQSEWDDDVKIIYNSNDTFSEDMTFSSRCRVTLSDGYDSMWLATITCSGTWSASKDAILVEYDKNSFEYDFNNSMLDSNDKEEVKEEFLKAIEAEGYKVTSTIKGEITDTFETVDDGETITYHRVR